MLLCTNCGFKNPDGSKFCVKCGFDLSSQSPPVVCPSCGAENATRSTFCETCGKRITPEVQAEKSPDQPAPMEHLYPPLGESRIKSFFRSQGGPFVAGLLLVIGGALDILNGIVAFNREIPTNDLGIDISGYVACCATLSIIFGLGAILGGWLSFIKKYFYAVLVGAIMGMLGFGYYGLGALVCFIALIVVVISKDDYSG